MSTHPVIWIGINSGRAHAVQITYAVDLPSEPRVTAVLFSGNTDPQFFDSFGLHEDRYSMGIKPQTGCLNEEFTERDPTFKKMGLQVCG